jgi:ubiquinone/menaquinone biosynthesis C-methylase UbiE
MSTFNYGGEIILKEEQIRKHVKKRYSRIAKSGASCCPSGECGGMSFKEQAKMIGYSDKDLEKIPVEANMGLGCGNPIALADLKKGETVLDLGSGGGMDVFLAAKKVGSTGRVIGIDMTKAMIEKAMKTSEKYGYKNVEFRLGEIENMPVEDNSIDVLVSNCVINLSPDKKQVFHEAYRVLKPNGRMHISDIVTEGKLPTNVLKNLDAWAACVSGAMEKKEYLKVIEEAGFKKVKIVSESSYEFDVSKDLKGKVTSLKVEAQKL